MPPSLLATMRSQPATSSCDLSTLWQTQLPSNGARPIRRRP
jgi:hypothetical protein